MKRFILILVGALFLAFSPGTHKGDDGDGVKKDTVRAMVMYGEDQLFAAIDSLSDESIQSFHDSLKMMPGIPMQLLQQIEVFMEVKTLSRDEMAMYLDSLFESGAENFALINSINRYLIHHQPETIHEYYFDDDKGEFPADKLYGAWDIRMPHPYKVQLAEQDKELDLKLCGGWLGKYSSPVDKVVLTSSFGYRWGRMHRGTDLDVQVWDPVYATFNGRVRYAGFYGGYGRVVVIRHHNGLETLYAHLHRLKVSAGDVVEAGQTIGLGGSSGNSTGSHLHFECRFRGVAINPEHIIDFREKRVVKEKVKLIRTQTGFAAIPEGMIYYEVKAGDYLYKIAESFGISPTKLCELNGIRRNSILRVGQKLRII